MTNCLGLQILPSTRQRPRAGDDRRCSNQRSGKSPSRVGHSSWNCVRPSNTVSSSSITSRAEALIRWNHPTRGLLSPVSFIEVLSQKPSAPEIGEWILRTACGQAAGWQRSIPNFRIGVNLFEAQFRTGQLAQVVEKALAETGLPAASLELEIVENILLRNDDSTLRLLQELRSLGVGLAFDDYGTGFASLSLLKRYPVTRLKIDRSFIRDVTTDAEDVAVVKAVIYLGRSFGMEVIAEGVETEEQLDFLKTENCAEVQGYLFGKPMTAGEFEARFLSGDKVKASSDT
ncbi:putative bifunctional diguanylate cyclase/phosphodiesterase [Agrobacterium vitis]|uniref:putative bifunctional diguanylate cyclase/phosphodiesterase n=1 Tax=Agrobacterium vitis TaxID=373 RepID=UPI001F32B7EE|nr:EAL domain-containing protein [Agrobacterium vitis]